MSKNFYKDKPLVGLDISSGSIKAMSIDPRKCLVSGYGSIDLDPQKSREAFESSNSEYFTENIKTLFSEKIIGHLPSNSVAISLPTAKTYCRTFTLPYPAEKVLEDAVVLEAEQYIPIPSSSLYIDYEIVDRNRSKKITTVLMGAVPKSIVDTTIKSVKDAGLRPVLIEPSISAVTRLLTMAEGASLPTIVVDIGLTSTDIAVIDKGVIRVTGSVDVGSSTFTIDIAKKMNIPLENAHQLKVLNGLNPGPRQAKLKEALAPNLKVMLVEIQKVIRYYTERVNGEQKLEQLLVVGIGSNMPGIGEFFTDNLIIAARVASPWQKIDFGKIQEPPKQFKSRYLTVAGLGVVNEGKVWK